MKILERNYDKIYYILLLSIEFTLIFRQISTILIIVFVVFNAIFYKKLSYNKSQLIWLAIIASPFLLDIIFYWNNDVLVKGFKYMEKRLSLFIFPLLLLGYHKKLDFQNTLKIYGHGMVMVMVLVFIRYAILYTENLIKYLHGIHLWEMGYNFGNSIEIHAPALNMHLSFVSICCLYLFYTRKAGIKSFLVNGLFLLLSFGFVMYVNTRVAVVTTIIGYAIVSFFEIFKKKNLAKAIKISVILSTVIVISVVVFVKIFPYSVNKFTEGSFADMEYVGRLDEVEKPEVRFFNKLVTRVSIWKSALELASEKPLVGYGAADSKTALNNYYEQTNQKFLAKYKFPTHNQYIDFLLKFGVLGTVVVLFYILSIGYIGFKLEHPVVIAFCMLFFISNLTDDFLIRYDGITFSGLWFSIFANVYVNKTKLVVSEEG